MHMYQMIERFRLAYYSGQRTRTSLRAAALRQIWVGEILYCTVRSSSVDLHGGFQVFHPVVGQPLPFVTMSERPCMTCQVLQYLRVTGTFPRPQAAVRCIRIREYYGRSKLVSILESERFDCAV